VSEEPQVQIDQEPAALVQRANEGCRWRASCEQMDDGNVHRQREDQQG
jgi:hypothetical protein